MRRDINYFFGIGNLTRDPDLRYTKQETPVCRFSIAMGRRYQGKNGVVDEVTYINVSAWSKLAEICSRYLHKGSRVAVIGALRSNSWEDKNGERRISYEIRAENIQFLSPPQGSHREDIPEVTEFTVPSDFDDSEFSISRDVEATPPGKTELFTHEGEEPLGDLEAIPFDENEYDESNQSPF